MKQRKRPGAAVLKIPEEWASEVCKGEGLCWGYASVSINETEEHADTQEDRLGKAGDTRGSQECPRLLLKLETKQGNSISL